MKTRLVVGPPPLKYVDRLKTYSKGGTLPTRSNPLTVKGDSWKYAQENGVVFTRKKGSNKWIDLGSSDSMSKLSSLNQIARTAILDKYGKQLGFSQEKINKETNVLPVTPTVKSYGKVTDAMVDKLKSELSTPKGQMKYRPATGKAEVTSSPIDYLIGGLPKLGVATVKGSSKALTSLPKAPVKELTTAVKPTTSLSKTTTSLSKPATSLSKPTTLLSKPTTSLNRSTTSLPKYANGSSLNTASNIVKGVGGLASMIPGIGGIISSAVSGVGSTVLDMLAQQQANKSSFNKMYSSTPMMQKGGLIKRKDGSYSRRGLWDNIRANRGSGKKPTKQMLEQERKIKSKMEYGGMLTGKDDLSFYKGRSHANGGILVSQKGTPSKKAIAEVEGNETRYQRKNDTYIFSDKLVI